MKLELVPFLVGVAVGLIPIGFLCWATIHSRWTAFEQAMHVRYSAFQSTLAATLHNAKAEAQAEAAKVEGEVKKL